MSTRVASPIKTAPMLPFTPAHTGLLQRKCACGGSPRVTGECAECSKNRLSLQRATRNSKPETANSDAMPPIVHEVLRSPGQPLDAATRAFMEPRFGHDFSQVRVHTDAKAAESARAVNAMAYTVGRDIVFGDSVRRTSEGQKTLAHELAHVAQQSGSSEAFEGKGLRRTESSRHQYGVGHAAERVSHRGSALRIGQSGDAYEREADLVAEAVIRTPEPRFIGEASASGLMQRATVPLLQRKLLINPTDSIPLPSGVVGPPTPLSIAIQGLLGDTCPDGHFQVDSATGNVTPQHATFCQQPPPPPPYLAADVSSTPIGCQCICDVINNAQTTTIAFRAGPPGTSPSSVPGAGPGQAGVATSPTVSADPRFQGQYLIGGRWVDIPFHLIFAHELCGHALPKMRGTHAARGPTPPGGTPPSERRAVDVERQIAAEHSPPLPRRPEDYAGGARERP